MNNWAGGEFITAASPFWYNLCMYATTSIRDAYRKFRAKDPSFLYAFGQQEFLVFVMGDALKIHEVLPDVVLTKAPAGYDTVRVHSQGFFQLVYRLVAVGQKVAMVARKTDAHGKVSYSVSERFDKGSLGK